MADTVVTTAPESIVSTITSGLSRLSRTQDQSGYAYTSLDISGKDLETVSGLENYIHLRYLNASSNALTSEALMSQLSRLEALVALNLSGNALTQVPLHAFPTSVQVLDCSKNAIKSITTTTEASAISNLTSLDLSENPTLESLAGLDKLPHLRLLNLSANRCTDPQLRAWFGDHSTGSEEEDSEESGTSKTPLQDLNLSQNELTRVPSTLVMSCPDLEALDLQANNMTSVASLFQDSCLGTLAHLSSLDVRDNPFCDTEEHFRLEILAQCKTLRVLNGEAISDSERVQALEYQQEKEKEGAVEEEEDATE